jgi:hypothetical protein
LSHASPVTVAAVEAVSAVASDEAVDSAVEAVEALEGVEGHEALTTSLSDWTVEVREPSHLASRLDCGLD